MIDLISDKIESLKEEKEDMEVRITFFKKASHAMASHSLKQAENRRIGVIHALRVLMGLKIQFLSTKKATLILETEGEYEDKRFKEKQEKGDNYFG